MFQYLQAACAADGGGAEVARVLFLIVKSDFSSSFLSTCVRRARSSMAPVLLQAHNSIFTHGLYHRWQSMR
jgi:hypothetical protein